MSTHATLIRSLCLLWGAASLVACTTPGGLSGPAPANNPVTVKNNTLSPCAQEVAEVKLSSQTPQARFNADIQAPGGFKHLYKVISIDTTGMPQGGTLTISGQLGSKVQGSFALLSSSPAYPCTGNGETALQSATNVDPGKSFTISHKFSSGQVFRFAAEGSWQAPEKTSDTVNLAFELR